MAINMCCEENDLEEAIMMWRHMIQKVVTQKTKCASILIDGIYDLGRVSEVQKYSLEEITIGVYVPTRIMRKLKNDLTQPGKQGAYEQLEKGKQGSYEQLENRIKNILSQPNSEGVVWFQAMLVFTMSALVSISCCDVVVIREFKKPQKDVDRVSIDETQHCDILLQALLEDWFIFW